MIGQRTNPVGVEGAHRANVGRWDIDLPATSVPQTLRDVLQGIQRAATHADEPNVEGERESMSRLSAGIYDAPLGGAVGEEDRQLEVVKAGRDVAQAQVWGSTMPH